MTPAILLAAMLTAAASPATDADQAAARASVGQWRLSEIGGKVGCTLTLTDRSGPGGREFQAPPACHLAFPPLRRLSVWSTDPHGALILSDADHSHVVAFAGPPGGPFQATASDGKAWRLEPAAPRSPAPAAP